MPYSQPNSFSKSSKLKEQNSKKKKKNQKTGLQKNY